MTTNTFTAWPSILKWDANASVIIEHQSFNYPGSYIGVSGVLVHTNQSKHPILYLGVAGHKNAAGSFDVLSYIFDWDEMTPQPTYVPSLPPSMPPSMYPSYYPSIIPTQYPSNIPSNNPTYFPTLQPSFSPTVLTSLISTVAPTSQPVLGDSQVATEEFCYCVFFICFALFLSFENMRQKNRKTRLCEFVKMCKSGKK